MQTKTRQGTQQDTTIFAWFAMTLKSVQSHTEFPVYFFFYFNQMQKGYRDFKIPVFFVKINSQDKKDFRSALPEKKKKKAVT